jgi:hypothetical protein
MTLATHDDGNPAAGIFQSIWNGTKIRAKMDKKGMAGK